MPQDKVHSHLISNDSEGIYVIGLRGDIQCVRRGYWPSQLMRVIEIKWVGRCLALRCPRSRAGKDAGVAKPSDVGDAVAIDQDISLNDRATRHE